MAKETWKAGNMLYPLPAVMVSVTDGEGNDNIITIAWAGTVCTNPPMVSISVRPSRYSYEMIRKNLSSISRQRNWRMPQITVGYAQAVMLINSKK